MIITIARGEEVEEVNPVILRIRLLFSFLVMSDWVKLWIILINDDGSPT